MVQSFFTLFGSDFRLYNPMKLGVRFRILALVSAIALMGASIAWIILNIQKQGRELQARLNNVDAETGEIVAQFKDSLRSVSNTRLQYSISHDPAVWREFQQASQQLSLWLDRQSLKLRTQDEKDALIRVRAAYEDYLRKAVEAPNPNAHGQTSAPGDAEALSEFVRARAELQHLFDLGADLANAHYASRNQLLAEARQRLGGLQSSVLILLALLFTFGIALAAVAYRDMIAPLRLKLVESRSLVERHEKLASLGMLAAGVAHEIRNPLTAIKAALFIQQKRLQAGTQEYADAEIVQREILRLERIVNDFLRFARPTEPVLTAMPVAETFQEIRSLLGPGLEKANIQFVMGPPPPWRVRADSEQIKQVLINLDQNAADSIGAKGVIRLGARRDRVRLADGETGVVILEVEDNGRGIPPEVQKRLFDPFFTTKDNGTGLGLSIAARIVEKHGGALQYQTRINRGTTFGIVLPEAAG
jgi:signal transduction histidine kinase